MWRISLTVSVLLLCLLAVPLSYFNPRSGHTYNILIAIGLFLIYQNGLTLLLKPWKTAKSIFGSDCCLCTSSCSSSQSYFCASAACPASPPAGGWQKSDIERRKMNLISRYIIRQMAVMAVYALLAFLALYSFLKSCTKPATSAKAVTAYGKCWATPPSKCPPAPTN